MVQSKNSIMIAYGKITINIAKETELMNAKPLETPTSSSAKFLPSQEETFLYQKGLEDLLKS